MYGRLDDCITISAVPLPQAQPHWITLHVTPWPHALWEENISHPSTAGLTMLPTKGNGIWTEGAYLHSSRDSKEHRKVQSLFFYLYNKIGVSRAGLCLRPGLWNGKRQEQGEADSRSRRSKSKKESVLPKALSHWGVACYYSNLAKADEYLGLLFSHVDQLMDCIFCEVWAVWIWSVHQSKMYMLS